jgi:predicted metal-dependent hydrolase
MRDDGRMGDWLLKNTPTRPRPAHRPRPVRARTSPQAEHLRGAEPVVKVEYDSKLHIVQHALGTHTTVSRVQGNKLKAKREIRIASLFKDTPQAFLDMIVVHELAHLRVRAHDKSFYQLCTHMLGDYHQLEFELRLYLTHLDDGGARLWNTVGAA